MKERSKSQGRTRGVYLGDDVIDRTSKTGRAVGVERNTNLSFSQIVEEALTMWNDAHEKKAPPPKAVKKGKNV